MNQDLLDDLALTIQATISEGIFVYKETLIKVWWLVGKEILARFDTLEQAQNFIKLHKKLIVPPCNEKNLEISVLFAHDHPDIDYYFTTVGKEVSWKSIRNTYEKQKRK